MSTVAATATKRLLKAYRLKGTHSPDANLNSMEKLSSVGLRTKKRGGKIEISLQRLKGVQNAVQGEAGA